MNVQSHRAASLPEGTKAQRVYLSLRDQISAGTLGAGDALLGEQKLAENFGVSRVTIRRALDALEADGLVVRRAGSGTSVRAQGDDEKAVTMDFTTLMPQVAEIGQQTTARLLSFTYGPVPRRVAHSMGVEPETEVQIAQRVRCTDETPFSHLTTYVPATIARSYSEADLAITPLFQLLERSGVQIKEAHQSVSATLAGPEVAEALNVAVGSALLCVNRVVKDIDGQGVEFLSGLYRPDLFRLEMPLTRVGQGFGRHWEPAIGREDGRAL